MASGQVVLLPVAGGAIGLTVVGLHAQAGQVLEVDNVRLVGPGEPPPAAQASRPSGVPSAPEPTASASDGKGGGSSPPDVGATARQLVSGLWIATGGTPSEAELEQAIGRYAVVVLNAWDTDALHYLKAQDPDITVLVYKCLSSTRSYRGAVQAGKDATLLPAGVGYAAADPKWFALDKSGNRIEWGTYPGHWQMAVWDSGYQRAWSERVTQEVVAAGWDGVLADNDVSSLHYYSSAILAGTNGHDETDARIRDGLDGLISTAGAALQQHGKLLIPNISDARLFPGRWAQHSRFGGAMDENFAHWGTDPGAGFVSDWGKTGWIDQSAQAATGRLSLFVTRASAGDQRALRYGWATAAVRGQGQVAWAPSTTNAYRDPETSPLLELDLGAPTGPGTRSPSGAWTRTFARGWVAVNPTTAAVSVRGPDGTPVSVPPQTPSTG